MNPSTDCERVRLHLMARRDGETVPEAAAPHPDAEQHLAFCSSCSRWLQDLESMNSRFQGVSYADAHVDLWTALESRIRPSEPRLPGTNRLALIGACGLGFRALQLMVDLPLPLLHPLVPMAVAAAALWQFAGDPLRIQTFAPELEKRGA